MKLKPLAPFARYIAPSGKLCMFLAKGDKWQEVENYEFAYITTDGDRFGPDGKSLSGFVLKASNSHTLNALRDA